MLRLGGLLLIAAVVGACSSTPSVPTCRGRFEPINVATPNPPTAAANVNPEADDVARSGR
jgi:hypothetical protein